MSNGVSHVTEPPSDDSESRQPVHTVYGGAHLFAFDTAAKLGALALKALDEYAPDAAALAAAFELAPALAERIYPRVLDKLTREPIEDFRIDFEDGFGSRPDEEEDRYARSAAEEVARGLSAGTLPAGIGIRIKNLGDELKRRSLRTFELFLTALLERSGGVLPRNFVVTLPKITAPEQVAAMASACDAFERARGLAAGTLKFELMVETTQSIFAADGTVALPRLIAEGRGRIVAAHFGTYDYTAACGITAAHQHMMHPACDFAKHVMQVALAGTRHRPVGRRHQCDAGRPAQGARRRRAHAGPASGEHRGRPSRLASSCDAHAPFPRRRPSTRAGTCIRPSCHRATPRSMRSFSKGSTPRPSD